MKKSRTLTVIIACYVASVAVYQRLPEPYLPEPALSFLMRRATIAFMLPTAAALIYGLLEWLKTTDRIRDRDVNFETTYSALVFRIVLFITGLHAVLLIGFLGGALLVPRATVIVLGITVVGIGNLLPRLRPNVAIGLPTSHALMDRGAWMRMHRAMGYFAVSLGTAMVVWAILGLKGWMNR